jgi:hypothetical protein
MSELCNLVVILEVCKILNLVLSQVLRYFRLFNDVEDDLCLQLESMQRRNESVTLLRKVYRDIEQSGANKR